VIGSVIEEINNKKAPGENEITAEIYKLTFKIFPKLSQQCTMDA